MEGNCQLQPVIHEQRPSSLWNMWWLIISNGIIFWTNWFSLGQAFNSFNFSVFIFTCLINWLILVSFLCAMNKLVWWVSGTVSMPVSCFEDCTVSKLLNWLLWLFGCREYQRVNKPLCMSREVTHELYHMERFPLLSWQHLSPWHHPSLSANGSTAFIWKLCCHWLKVLDCFTAL